MRPQSIGAIAIDKIIDIAQSPWQAGTLLPDVTPAMLAAGRGWLPPGFIHPTEDVVYLSFHSYVLRTPQRTILVDTCVGNCKQRHSLQSWHMLKTPYLDELAKVGLQPADIDIVLCTHLHADHVGWNTQLLDGRWVPTFPNARYIMGRTEFEHWQRLHDANPATPVTRGAFADSVLPVVEAGQALLVESDYIVAQEADHRIWLEPSPGHSAGHVTVHVESGQDHAVLSGDVIHHPLQFTHPQLCSAADIDREQSRRSRLALLESLADTPTLLLTAHFPSPTAGHVTRRGDAFGFRFIEA
jgi:glyoxylase-like metal-dependent hydrolase (beta-lactamase superfamily II)